MILDFSKIEETAAEGFKGGTGVTHLKKFENRLGKIIMGRLEPGASIGLHTHEEDSEIIYIISGKADFIYEGGTESADPGMCHYCPKGSTHQMINNGSEDIVFFAAIPKQ